MIHIIYPLDKTTTFLLGIPQAIEKRIGRDSYALVQIDANDDSYAEGLEYISSLPSHAQVLFMGHGQNDCLLGGENENFLKKAFIDLKTVKVFANKFLFSLSCYSNEFLKSTFRYSNIVKSVGFGLLPSEISEVQNDKRLMSQGVSDDIIGMFKDILVDIVSGAFCDIVEKGLPFIEVANYLNLRLNKRISEVILTDKRQIKNRILANLLFQLKSEMVVI